MNIDREALAWAGGLFEGEGSFVLGKGSGAGQTHYRNIRAIFCTTDKDVMLKFDRVLIGVRAGIHVRKNHAGHLGKKRVYQWSTGSFEGCQAVIACLWPWLGIRRKARAREILLAMREYYAIPGCPQKGMSLNRAVNR